MLNQTRDNPTKMCEDMSSHTTRIIMEAAAVAVKRVAEIGREVVR